MSGTEEGSPAGLQPGDPVVRGHKIENGLVTNLAWTPGGKLGLGCLGLTKSQVPGTQRGSPSGQNLA